MNGSPRLHNLQFNKRFSGLKSLFNKCFSGLHNSIFSKYWEWHFQASQPTVQQTLIRALQLTVQQTMGMVLPGFTTNSSTNVFPGLTTHCSANTGNGTSWLHNTGLHNSLLSKLWEWHFLASQYRASQLTAQQTLGMALPGFTTQGFTTHCSANSGNGTFWLHNAGLHNSLLSKHWEWLTQAVWVSQLTIPVQWILPAIGEWGDPVGAFGSRPPPPLS